MNIFLRLKLKIANMYIPLTICSALVFCLFVCLFGCVGSLLLHAGFLSSCGEQGLLFVVVRGLLIVVASLVAEHGL